MAPGLIALRVTLVILGLGSTVFALISLADGVAFSRRVSASLRRNGDFQPMAVILVPVRGSDPTMARTLHALRNQEYSDSS